MPITKGEAEMIADARQACGCHGCQGGFDIGARTVAAPDRAAPSSCVANTILAAWYDGKRRLAEETV